MAGFVWAVVVAGVHFPYAIKKVPLTLLGSLDLLTNEAAIGPFFLTFWLAHLVRVVACLLFLAGVRRIGRYFLHRIIGGSAPPSDGPVESALSFGLGLVFIGYLAFAILLVPGVAMILLRIFFAGLCVVGIKEMRMVWAASKDKVWHRSDAVERVLFMPLACGVALAFIGTTAPEISYDALVYHLAVPQSYLSAGQMIDLPYNHYSYLPLLTSLLYVWGLAVDGMYMAKLMNWFIGMALLHALYAFASGLKGRKFGLAACALFITIPTVTYLHWVANSDLGAALFLMFALMCCLKWREFPTKIGFLYLAGLFCGAGLATKYTTAIGVAAIMTYCNVRLYSVPVDRKWRVAGCFALLLVLPLLPWFVRNFVFQGNPFFPYATEYFGGRSFDPELLRNWYAETRHGSPGLALTPHLLKIWRDVTVGMESTPYNYMGPLLVGLAPLSIVFLGRSLLGTVLCASMGAYILGLSATHISRLSIPYLAVATAGLSYCLAEKSRFRPMLLALFLALSMHNLYRIGQILLLTSVKGLKVGMGQQTPEQYLSRARNWYPDPSFGAFRHIGGLKLPKEERILVIGDPRTFYSPRLAITNAPHDIPVVFHWANSAQGSNELDRKLISENVSVVVSNKSGSQHTDSRKYVNERNLAMIGDLLAKKFTKIYEDEWAVVFQARAALQ